jgi:NAD(P)-dependent dehydrogenase (short-subunit alcohol dehydrogenase family)
MSYTFLVFSIFFIIITLYVILKKLLSRTKLDLHCPMDGKTIIITSSNVGIGKEMALDLLSNGAKVVFACIDQAKTNEVINSIQDDKIRSNAYFIRVDWGSFKSIFNFVDQFQSQFNDFDIFINNNSECFEIFGKSDGIENNFMINHIAPIVMILLLLSFIKPKGRIINLTGKSFTYLKQEDVDRFIGDKEFTELKLKYKKVTALAISKLSFLCFALHLDRYFQKKSVDLKIVSLDPGFVLSNPSSYIKSKVMKLVYYVIMPIVYMFVKDPKLASRSPLNLAYMDYSNLSSSGYYSNDKLVNISSLASVESNRKKIIDFSFDLIKENFKDLPPDFIKYFN